MLNFYKPDMGKLLLYFTFLFTCLIFSSCKNDHSTNGESKETDSKGIIGADEMIIREPVVISGIVREASEKWITLLHKDAITGRKSYTVPIDKDGNFQFLLELPYSQDLYLYYTTLSYIYCSPGDSLQLYFNGRRYVDSLTFEGTNAKANVQLHTFLDGVEFNKLYDLRNRNLPQQKFLDLANRYKEECFLLISKISPGKEMAVWMDTYTRFLFSEMKYEYAKSNKINPENNYFEFLSELDSLGMDIKSCSEAYGFIQQYYDYQLEKEGLNKSLQLAYDNDNYFTFAMENMAFVSENPTNINKLALARILYPVIDYNYQIIDSLITEYSEVVQDEYLREIIKERIKYNRYENAGLLPVFTLDSLSNFDLVGDIFKEIMENSRNKALYFDFWGVYCTYCIQEFPASAKLKEALRDRDIEFIYFCAPSETKKQQDIIQRYNLEGKHYMLTNDQLKALNSHFGFTALPRYMIVDKQGKFIDTNAEKPSSDKILRELYELADE